MIENNDSSEEKIKLKQNMEGRVYIQHSICMVNIKKKNNVKIKCLIKW